MARGNDAKAALIKRFAAAVGADYLGEADKKYYFLSEENGEKIQVAISMTCPKTPVVFNGNGGDLDFTDTPTASASTSVDLDADEKATLERLMKDLGL